MGIKKNHPVLPSKKQLSEMAFQAANNAVMVSEDESRIESSLGQLALPLDESASELMIANGHKVKKVDISQLDSLERETKAQIQSNFVLSKAKTMDNLPEKAQERQRQQILKKSIDDRYVADNYYPQANMDEILFEKDGTISKMKQFDYKVHKFIRRSSKKQPR